MSELSLRNKIFEWVDSSNFKEGPDSLEATKEILSLIRAEVEKCRLSDEERYEINFGHKENYQGESKDWWGQSTLPEFDKALLSKVLEALE